MMENKYGIGNGHLALPAAWGREFTVFGGPFRQCPLEIGEEEVVSLKLAPEIKAPCTFFLPIVDFSVPTTKQVDTVLPVIMDSILKGDVVYAGCMGGMGRTGLFLAVLAKAWGIPEPVKYVRENYYAHAVETANQAKFVAEYQIPEEVTKMVKRAKFWSFFGWTKHMTPAVAAL